MNSEPHRNWALAVLKPKLPILALLIFGAVILVTLLTFLLSPIYSATAILAIDSDLARQLNGVSTPFPSVTNTDYIRYEYFSSHSIQLLQLPQIGRDVANRMGLRDRFGRALSPEFLVQPDILRLVFGNDGQGVKVDWITDTQTFAITGLSKDPEQAVRLSQTYTEAFLTENANQYKAVIQKLIERLDTQSEELARDIIAVDQEIQWVKDTYRTSGSSEEPVVVVQRIGAIKALLEAESAKEAKFQTQFDQLKKQAQNLEKLEKVERIFESNPVIDTIKTEIRTLSTSLAAAAVEYSPAHPDYKQIEKKLHAAKQDLQKETARRFSTESEKRPALYDTVMQTIVTLSMDHLALSSQIEYYGSAIAAYEQRIKDLNTAYSLLQNASVRKDAMAATLTQAMKDKYKLESILKNSVSYFRLVSQPTINMDFLGDYKYFPKRKRILAFTFVVAALASVFAFFGRELVADKLYFGWQIGQQDQGIGIVNVPCLQTAPYPESSNLPSLELFLQDIVASEKNSPILRVTSPAVGEGKASVALSIARYYRRTGEKVLLVDGDTANASLTRTLGMDHLPGLLEYLSGKNSLSQVIAHSADDIPVIPLSRTTAGEKAGQTGDLEEQLAHLADHSPHLVFVDSPLTNDYSLLGEHLPPSIVLMVIQSGRYSAADAREMLGMRRLHSERAKLRWVIVNRIETYKDTAHRLLSTAGAFARKLRPT